MNLFRVIFELFVLYLLYKLVFDFIIPVYQTTRQVKKQFGDMQSKMQEQMNRHQPGSAPTNFTAEQPTPKSKDEDYIDFEEVK